MVRVIKVALFILSVIAVCYVDCSVLLQPEAVAGGAAHAADHSSTFSSKTYTIDMVKHSTSRMLNWAVAFATAIMPLIPACNA